MINSNPRQTAPNDPPSRDPNLPRAHFYLETERICFREWCPSDEALVSEFWSDSIITKYLGGPFSAQRAAEWLQEAIQYRDMHGVQYWPMFDRDSNQHIGCCGLIPIPSQSGGVHGGVYQIGIYLRADYQRKGLGVEALRGVVGYAFQRLQANCILAGHHRENITSGAALKKAGFIETSPCYYEITRERFCSLK